MSLSSFLFLSFLGLTAVSCAPLADLGSYYVTPDHVYASGISAGAYMASQFAIAFSNSVHGAGKSHLPHPIFLICVPGILRSHFLCLIFEGNIAGGPYYCAQASMTTALTACMSSPTLINVNNLIKQAEAYSV